MSIISNIKNFFNHAILRKPRQPIIESTDSTTVPFHIKAVGKMYPILHTVASNQARGEIKKFNFCQGQKNTLRVGHHVSMSEGEYETLWVCLGNDYFKLIMKA